MKKIESTKYSTFRGVFLPSALPLFGVILFLRLGYILGNIGIIPLLFIISISSLITFLSGLSISVLATNMRLRGGGAYFMISRSFGIEIGSAIGIALFFAQVIGIAFYIEGFSESVRFLFPGINPFAFEAIALALIALISSVSSNNALKIQFVTFVFICLALISFFFGNYIEPSTEFSPYTLGFWGAFALFFPAVTGIESGLSMSGELQNPRKSLPVGTLYAVLTGFVIYSLVTCVLWFRIPEDILRMNPMALFQSSQIESLIFIAIWGGTLSSAISGLLAAPRTLQALAKDGIVPKFLGKGFGMNNEPRIAVAVTFAIAAVCLFYGDINLLAPVLTMFFLISYGMLNLATGLEGLLGNPSWRPTFTIPYSLSLIGAFLCLTAMLMISPGATFISIIFISCLYLIAKRKNLGKGWEDIRQGILFFFCRFAIYRLVNLGPSARSWRPYFLVFASSPTQKTSIIEFANSMTKGKGFLTVASIVSTENLQHEKIEHLKELTRTFLQKKKIQCLVEIKRSNETFQGMKNIITNYGLGPISPNTIILGYSPQLSTQAPIVRLANQLEKNLVIFKNTESSKNGSIDIWWDDESRSNNELITVLAYMLKDTVRWKGSPVIVKCVVPNEEAREQRIAYFKDFFAMSRLTIEVKVFVVPDKEEISIKTISKLSSNASILFFGLRHPLENETDAAYELYLKNLAQKTSHINCLAFVMGEEKSDLTKIFEYPLL